MDTDDDINEYQKKINAVKLSDDFSHFTEEVTRAREEFKTSVEPYLGTIRKISDSAITIGQKIEPLLKIQAQLVDTASSMGATASAMSTLMPKTTIDLERFSRISEEAIQTGKSLQAIQELTIKSQSLFREANYDLLTNPISSTLSIASDSVALQQKNILGDLDFITRLGTVVLPKPTELYSAPLRISDVVLGTLEESPYLFPSTETIKIPTFRDPTDERIEKLENQVKNLKEERERDIIIEINHEVESLLLKIDSSLVKMFKGAYAVVNQNDDSLGQSAESMTRLLENLPFCLAKDFKSLQKNKEDAVKETLAVYLQIEYESIDNINHPLISQQHHFYDTFSQIRHRNKDVYNKFEKDPARYKALILQVEGFLYQLIKR